MIHSMHRKLVIQRFCIGFWREINHLIQTDTGDGASFYFKTIQAEIHLSCYLCGIDVWVNPAISPDSAPRQRNLFQRFIPHDGYIPILVVDFCLLPELLPKKFHNSPPQKTEKACCCVTLCVLLLTKSFTHQVAPRKRYELGLRSNSCKEIADNPTIDHLISH